MKLISCHIENFGGLSGYGLKFSDGLTVVAEPNGFGKTALAEFIRAMFYGFGRAGKSLEKDLRKKYLPWQGGVYGGSLTFEHEGKHYRIERTFGRVPKDDTFIMYDINTRRKSAGFSKNVGLELFGLDADSFVRSTYMPQTRDSLPLSTDSIRAKLGGLIEDSNDVNNFEKAVEALRSKRSMLEAFRGGGGAVAESAKKISLLQSQLKESEESREELLLCRQEMARLTEEQKNLKQKSETLRGEIRGACEDAARISLLEQYKEQACLTFDEQSNLRELKSFFASGLPSDAEIDRQKQILKKTEELTGQQERFKSFEKRLAADKARAGRISKTFISVLSAGAVSAAAGILLLALRRHAAGGVLFLTAVVFLAASAYMHLKRSFSKRQAEKSYGIICGHLKENEAELKKLKNMSDKFFGRYNPCASPSENGLDEIARKRREYISLKGREGSLAQKRREADAKINGLTRALSERFAPFSGARGAPRLSPSQPLADIEMMKSEEKNIDSQLDCICQKIQDLTVRISGLQTRADQMHMLGYELDMYKEKKAEDIRRRELLDMTVEFLTKAKEQLSLRYLGGVRKRFETHMLRLADEDGGRFFVNPDLGVSVERFGATREMAYLSAGQTDIVMLCMRLALIDELFKDTVPLIILDDPFVNLDDANTRKALSALKSLTKGHQILYLVCNSSRSPGQMPVRQQSVRHEPAVSPV